jgi:S1-C subfamily serine protease
MTRILILLATVVLVGCPQQSYQTSGNSYQTLNNPSSANIAEELNGGWCVLPDGKVPIQMDRDPCFSQEGRYFYKRKWAESYIQWHVVGPTPTPTPTPIQDGTLSILGAEHTIGAEVCINGVYRGLSPIDVDLSPGLYTVRVEKDSRLSVERKFTVEAGRTKYWRLSLRPGKRIRKCGAPSFQPPPTPTPEPDYQLVSTGTGFVVNKTFVVTADHVLRKNERGDACDAISIVYRKDEYEAQGVDADPANDLGLIKLSKPIESTAKLRGQPDLIQGEMAVNYGFPLMGELSTSAKVTGGSVNSLSGYNNNSSFLQYDAASQHGNSGGPVLDASGNIIGVVSSKLDDAETQLVNFATKSTILEGFLRANKVPFEKADLGEKLELPDIAEKAETFTVLVGCWE